jgi:hypothetical protein
MAEHGDIRAREGSVSSCARPFGFRHRIPAPGVQLPPPGARGADHAGCARGLRRRTPRVQRRTRARAPAGELPAYRGHIPPGQQPQRRALRPVAARVSQTCVTTIGRQSAMVRVLLRRIARRRASQSCADTSSSKPPILTGPARPPPPPACMAGAPAAIGSRAQVRRTPTAARPAPRAPRGPHPGHGRGGRWSRVPGAVRWEGDHRHGCP